MQKTTPCLWFDNQAQEAANFYISVFPNSKINKIDHYMEATEEVSGKPKGSVMTVEFEIDGMEFVALNGGKIPGFQFSPAISFIVNCQSQEEVDKSWEKLSADPASEQCGWLKDKYGVSWQIVPTILNKLLRDPDAEKAEKVMAAMLQMKKIDIEGLKKAYEG